MPPEVQPVLTQPTGGQLVLQGAHSTLTTVPQRTGGRLVPQPQPWARAKVLLANKNVVMTKVPVRILDIRVFLAQKLSVKS
jgi:hypothetical protein